MKKSLLILTVVAISLLASSSFALKIGDYAIQDGGGNTIGIVLPTAMSVDVQFLKESAGFHSTFGYFTFTDETDVNTFTDYVLWPDASQQPDGPLVWGDTASTMVLPGDTKIGLWLEANGANITDPAKGPIYRTTAAGSADGMMHAVATIDPAKYWIKFEWEDLPQLGDEDFNDVIVKIGAPMPVAGMTFGVSSLLSSMFLFVRKRRLVS